MPDRWQFRRNGSSLGRNVDNLAVVKIAIAGNQDLGLDLAEAIENSALAEVGRAGRPDGTDGIHGKESGDCVGMIGNDGAHTVARSRARRSQQRGDGRNFRLQLTPAQGETKPVLATKNDCRLVAIRMLKEILRIVEPSLGKEARVPHVTGFSEECLAASFGQYAEIVPHG